MNIYTYVRKNNNKKAQNKVKRNTSKISVKTRMCALKQFSIDEQYNKTMNLITYNSQERKKRRRNWTTEIKKN